MLKFSTRFSRIILVALVSLYFVALIVVFSTGEHPEYRCHIVSTWVREDYHASQMAYLGYCHMYVFRNRHNMVAAYCCNSV